MNKFKKRSERNDNPRRKIVKSTNKNGIPAEGFRKPKPKQYCEEE